MSITGMGEKGQIVLFEDFCGPDLPVANAEAATTPGHFIGPFRIVGDTVETDSGVVLAGKSSGYATLTVNDENGKGVGFATDVCFSPALNGPIVVEARVETSALTARNIFVGLASTIAADVAEPVTATTVTITKVVPCIGFILDSQLTDSAAWHMPYILASDTTQTSTDVDASQDAVAGESDVLRLVVNTDGSAEWWINGKLEQTVGAGKGATTTTLQGALVAGFGTTTTAADLSVDYMLVKANRDWTR
jgi:hypothetical protein